MTVSTSRSVAQFVPQGAVTVFDFQIPFFENRHIFAVSVDADGGETLLSEGVDYSLLSQTGGGRLTLASPLPGDHLLRIQRSLPYIQDLDLSNEDGLRLEVLEDTYDKLVMLIQQLNDKVNQAAGANVGTTLVIEDLADRLNDLFNTQIDPALRDLANQILGLGDEDNRLNQALADLDARLLAATAAIDAGVASSVSALSEAIALGDATNAQAISAAVEASNQTIADLDLDLRDTQTELADTGALLAPLLRQAAPTRDEIRAVANTALQALISADRLAGEQSKLGITVDADTGVIRSEIIEAINKPIEDRLVVSESVIEQQAGEISLRVTQAEMNQAILAAAFNPSSAVEFLGLEARIGQAEISLDAAEATIEQKASQTVVDDLTLSVNAAQIRLDGVEAEISLKADALDLDAAEQRLTQAEVDISAIDGGSITQVVRDARNLEVLSRQDQIAMLQGLLFASESDFLRGADTASATRQISARIVDEREARASDISLLTAQIESSAAIALERTDTVATSVSAIASQIVVLEADIGDTNALIVDERSARVSGESAAAQQIGALNARANTASAEVSALNAALADETSARIQALDSATARIDTVSAAVVALADITASADAAAIERLDGLAGTVADNAAAIVSERNLRVSTQSAQAGQIDALQVQTASAQVNALAALDALVVEENARVSAVDGVIARINSVSATVSDVVNLNLSPGKALMTRLNGLDSSVTDIETGLESKADASQLSDVANGIDPATGQPSVRASQLDAVRAAVNDPSTGLSQKATVAALSSVQNDVDGLSAEYIMRVSVEGTGQDAYPVIGGIALRADSQTQSSNLVFAADRFAFVDPNNTPAGFITPFFYQDGILHADNLVVDQLWARNMRFGPDAAGIDRGVLDISDGSQRVLLGPGIGPGADLVLWIGQDLSEQETESSYMATATRANALMYLSRAGRLFLSKDVVFGSDIGGEAATESIARSVNVTTSVQPTNGGIKRVEVSYTFRGLETTAGTCPASDPRSPDATVYLYRVRAGGATQLASWQAVDPGPPFSGFSEQEAIEGGIQCVKAHQLGGSWIFEDTDSSTDDLAYRVGVVRSDTYEETATQNLSVFWSE